jgi:hypothetical protein
MIPDFKMSRQLKDKTKEDMSKVLDCSSFQIKPLQACIAETTLDDFNLPDSGKLVYLLAASRNKTWSSIVSSVISCRGFCLNYLKRYLKRVGPV